MGEIKFEKKALVEAINTTSQETEQTTIEQSVAVPCGRFHVRWDEDGKAQHCLFKLRQNAGVECLIERPWQQGDRQNAGQGILNQCLFIPNHRPSRW